MSAFSKAWLFFAVTFAFSWACQTPAILVLRAELPVPPIVMGMMALGSAGPSLVALWFWLLERKTLQKQRPERDLWLRPRWQLWTCALLFNPVSHLFGSGMLWLFGHYSAQYVLYLPLLPEQMAIAIIAPLGEELGFRGYALPRLQARLSPLAASLCIGLVWAVWHVPTFFVPGARGASPIELSLYLVCFVSGSVVYTWLYNAGRGSLIGPLLAHLGIHLDNVYRASTLGDGVSPLAVTALSMTAIATCLVASGQLRPATAVRCTPRASAGERAGGVALASAANGGQAW